MTEADPGAGEPAVPPPPGPGVVHGGGRQTRKHTALAAILSALGVLVVAAIILGFLIHLPYVLISPGNATPLDDSVVTISGAPTYEHSTDVLFLTVRVTNSDPTVWRVVHGWLDPDIAVEKRGAVVGCLTPEESTTYNQLLMQQSQDDAKVVALTRLGYSVTADAPRVTVVTVCPGSPAHGLLVVGDQVTAVDDHAVTSSQQVVDYIRAQAPGARLHFTVTRSGAAHAADVVTGELSSDGQKCGAVSPERTTTGAACIGVSTQQFVTYHFPIDVRIDTQRVGGPSAGLAFALAIIDDLTPGSLTGRERVAVTGAITTDGKVEPVGGVEQKAITARANGVQLMLVPRSEVRDARKGAGSLKVVGVDTVDEALSALQLAGGASVPLASASVARS